MTRPAPATVSFILSLAAFVLAVAPIVARAQEAARIYRIGLVSPTSLNPGHHVFLQRIAELGYVDGKNAVIEMRFAQGRDERLPQLIDELLRARPDILVVTSTTTALAAKKATTTTPIVFAALIDPVATGIVANLARDSLRAAGPDRLQRLLELCRKHKLPAICASSEYAEAGCLMSYGPATLDHYSRGAEFVDKILKGANPADLPMEQPMTFELVINLKTAKALELEIPQSMLLRANRVIE